MKPAAVHSALSDNPVTNFSRMTYRRIYWKIDLDYASTAAQLRFICDRIRAYLRENGAFVDDPDVSTFVVVDSFSDSSIDLLLYCFTKTTEWGEWLAAKEDLALTVKAVVEEAGTSFAFPSQTNYLVDVANSPEMVEPPAVKALAASALGRE